MGWQSVVSPRAPTFRGCRLGNGRDRISRSVDRCRVIQLCRWDRCSCEQYRAWDGTKWSTLGLGTSDMIEAVAVYQDKLYAGGEFTSAGGLTTKGVASWDGTTWSEVGGGVQGQVFSMIVAGDQLIVGSAWSTLGSGVTGSVSAIIEFNGELVVGGYFETAGGVQAQGIASWNGVSWSPLSEGVSGDGYNERIVTLSNYYGLLIAGGHFASAGDVTARHIASWNGGIWSSLRSGLPEPYEYVYALTIFDGKLIVGGAFALVDSVQNVTAENIAAWGE